VLESYVGKGNCLTDELISPAIAPEFMLRQFPPIRIMCAGLDPLRDSSYVLAYRLAFLLYRKLNVNIQLYEYTKLAHGYWNYSKFISPLEARNAVDKLIEYIKELAK